MIWLTGIAALLALAIIALELAPLYPGVVALGFAFSPQSFAAIVHSWSAEDLLLYRRCLAANYLFLACYGAFGYLLAARSPLFASWPFASRRAMAWALPVAASFGATANTLHVWLTEAPRFGVPLVYAVSAASVALESVILLAFGLALIHALARQEP